MNIEIKFNIGDTIWFMFQNKPTTAKVDYIEANIKIDNCKEIKRFVIYTPNNNTVTVEQSRCFATKEELLKSL